MNALTVSLFYDKRDNVPRQQQGTWDYLVSELQEPRISDCGYKDCQLNRCAHKNGPGWSPARYREGATRGLNGVNEVTLLVLDFDHLSDRELDASLSRLTAYQHVVHASHSDRPGNRCVRAIVALSRPVIAKDWMRFWRSAVHALGVPIDRQASDASRLFFLPSRPTEACHVASDGTGYFFYVHDGDALDVDAILELTPIEPKLVELTTTATPRTLVDSEMPGEDNQVAAAEALAKAWPPPGKRHAALVALSGALAHQGWSVDAIATFVEAVYTLLPQYSGDFEDRIDKARAAFNRYHSGGTVGGWPSLRELLGGAVVDGADLIDVACGHLGVQTVGPKDPAFMGGMAQVSGQAPPSSVTTKPSKPKLELAVEEDEITTEIAMLLEDIGKHKAPPVRTYPTTNVVLNQMLGGGIKTRQLLVIVAPPGDGKSAYVVDTALNLEQTTGRSKPSAGFPDGYDLGVPILYVSTELEKDEIRARFAANLLDLLWTDIVQGNVPEHKVEAALVARRIHVIGAEEVPMNGDEVKQLIWLQTQAVTRTHGVPPLVIVDYLQDLARDGADDEKKRVGNLATFLRSIAQVGDCAVWAVSSVSRSYYGIAKAEQMRKHDDPKVYLAAAKESGNVDYAAASIVFLDVGLEPKEPGNPGRPARLCLAKCRHGRPGFAGARFFGASGRWLADENALEEVLNQSQGNSKAREDDVKRDAVAITKEVSEQKEPVTCTHASEQLGRKLGWGKPRAKAAVDRAVMDGLLEAKEISRIEGHKRVKRTCLFVPGSAPPLDETVKSETPPSPPNEKAPAFGKFLKNV